MTGVDVLVGLFTVAIGALFCYSPFLTGTPPSPREQALFNFLGVLMTVLVGGYFTLRQGRRETIREVKAIAKASLRRVQEARQCARTVLEYLQQKRSETGHEDTLVAQQFLDLEHQVTNIDRTLEGVRSDWQQILPDDLARQAEIETQVRQANAGVYAMLREYEESMIELRTQMNDALQKKSESEQDNERLKTELQRIEEKRRQETAILQSKLEAVEKKAAEVSKDALFPVTPSSSMLNAWQYWQPAFLSSQERVDAVAAYIRPVVAEYMHEHPEAGIDQVRDYLVKKYSKVPPSDYQNVLIELMLRRNAVKMESSKMQVEDDGGSDKAVEGTAQKSRSDKKN